MRKSKFGTSLFIGILLTAAAAGQSFANQIPQPEFTDEEPASQFKEAGHKPTTLPYRGPKPVLKEQPMEGVERYDSIGETIARRSISETPMLKERRVSLDKSRIDRQGLKEPCRGEQIIVVRGPVIKRGFSDKVFIPKTFAGRPLKFLTQTDLKTWQFQFTTEDKMDYMKMIAIGMLNEERLPRPIQIKMKRYGWNGYFYHLLKTKADSDRFFFETVRAMDWAINNKKHRNIKLWDMAIIEIIHTLNIHAGERSI